MVCHAFRDATTAAARRQHAVQVVRDSCLAQFLIKELYQTSFTEMSKRGQYYATVMHVARLLCVPELAPVLVARPAAGGGEANGTSAGSSDSVATVLDRAAAQARVCWSSLLRVGHPVGPSVSSKLATRGSLVAGSRLDQVMLFVALVGARDDWRCT